MQLPNSDLPATVPASLEAAARRFGARDAIVMGDDRLTYAELWDKARATAGALQALGVRHGSHVGILLPNCLDYLLLFFGCALLGARAIHINARFRDDDLRYAITHADIEVLITTRDGRPFVDYVDLLGRLFPALGSDDRAPIAMADAPKLRCAVCLSDDAPGLWLRRDELFRPATFTPPNVDPEDVALIIYTSGTTARPKACMLSHRALENAGRALAQRWRMDSSDRLLNALPFFHMSSMLPAAACRSVGAAFMPGGKFDAGETVRRMVAERATILYLSFPAISNAVFDDPEFRAADMPQARLMHVVGPSELLRRNQRTLPQAVHASAYGLSEAGGVVAYNGLDDTPDQCVETGGHPFDGVEVRIVDIETGQDVPQGVAGEILLRGNQMFSGYYKDDASHLAPGAWLKTGDRCSLDPDGRIVYHGRIKDMLKVGGENVAALEIETFLCGHPDVSIAMVIGVPDMRLGEVPAAFIELRPGASLAREDVVQFCRGKIAGYKVPRFVHFVETWPMSTTKVQKFKLAEMLTPQDRV